MVIEAERKPIFYMILNARKWLSGRPGSSDQSGQWNNYYWVFEAGA
jgi:hypothetical protein